MRWRHVAHSLLAIVFCLLGVLGFLLGTQAGLEFSLAVANRLLADTIEIQHPNGNILRGFTASNLSYHNQTININAKQITLKWRPLALLKGELQLHDLHLHDVSLTPSSSTTAGDSSLHIADLQINTEIERSGWQSHAVWSTLTWHIKTKKHLSSSQGQLSLHGQEQNYTLQANSAFIGENLPDFAFTLLGHGDLKQLHLTHVNCKTLDGQLSATAMLSWQSKLWWNFVINGKQLNPAYLSPMYPGTIDFRLHSHGTLVKQHWQLQHLTGQLQKQHLTGNADLQLDNDVLRINQVNLQLGSAKIQLQAEISHKTLNSLTWDIDIDDLSHLVSNSNGKLITHGNFSNDLWPKINTEIKADNVRFRSDYIKQLDAKLNIDLQPNKPLQGTINFNEISYKSIYLANLHTMLKGTSSHHTLQLQSRSEDHTANLVLAGKFNDTTWHATLLAATLASPVFGHWRVEQQPTMTLNKDSLALERSCFISTPGRLCIEGKWHATSPWVFTLQAEQLALNYLNTLLPAQHLVQSTATVNMVFGKNQHFYGDAAILLAPGKLSYLSNGNIHNTLLKRATLNSHLDNTSLINNLHIELDKQQDMHLMLRLLPMQSSSLLHKSTQLTGKLTIKLNQLALLQFFAASIKDIDGQLSVASDISGTLAKPNIQGQAELAIKHASIPTLGTSINNLHAHARGTNNGDITFAGQSQLGDGKLNFSGTGAFSQQGSIVKAHVQGERAQLLHTTEYHVLVSPDLWLNKDPNMLSIQGTIVIPSARLNPNQISKQVTRLPRDVIITQTTTEARGSQRMQAAITLLLGDDIKFASMGLTGKLSGDLQLAYTTSTNTRATGTLRIVNGQYHAYGQDLTIQRGDLIFTGGPIDNPGLLIEATKTIKLAPQTRNTNIASTLETLANIDKTQISLPSQQNDFTVGIAVTGQLLDPNINLFSEPARLNQSDILSYLLFGRALNSTTTNDAQTLFQAASALRLNHNELNSINQQLQRSFGLDEISVETTPLRYKNDQQTPVDGKNGLQQNTSLILGKALSPKLYINYSIGLLTPINVLKVRYMLSSKWSLQTETSISGNGIDLFYSIEK